MQTESRVLRSAFFNTYLSANILNILNILIIPFILFFTDFAYWI